MEKKIYARPYMGFERFVPNHYCEFCFRYSIVMHCLIDQSRRGTYEPGYNSGYDHYHQWAYCGDNWIQVEINDGVPTYTGYENATHEGAGGPMDVRSVKNITPNIVDLEVGDEITYGEWQSYWEGNEYNHHGNGQVLSKTIVDTSHPNMS